MAMTVRPDAALQQALRDLARDEGISQHEVIRRSVLDRYERLGHGRDLHASSQRMQQRWGDVLDRLGRA
jgi:Ribbon-helix-helix protein, copG family